MLFKQNPYSQSWINLILILAAFIMNIWANLAPLTGLSIGEISRQYFSEVLIIPANYAFAIWGLIYLGLICLGIYGILPKNQDHPLFKNMGYLLAISSFVQIIWVFLFQFRFFALSVLAMIGILIPLIILYQKLEINLMPISLSERWLINYPISLYLGWISVATIINIASALNNINWKGAGISPLIWTIILLTLSSVLAIFLRIKRNDRVYPGVVIWALGAIAVKHWEQNSLALVSLGLGVILGIVLTLPNFTKR